MMSTTKANALMQESVCKRLGVEAFEADWMATESRPADETKLNESCFIMGKPQFQEVEFRCPIVRWKLNGEWYGGAVPLVLVERHESDMFSSSITWEMDVPAMELELRKMIEESRCL